MTTQAQTRLLQVIKTRPEKIKVIDVGAGAHATSCRYQPLLDDKIARVIGFEPNPDALADAKPNPDIQYLPHTIGDGSDATLYITRLPECSSIYKPNYELLKLFNSMSGGAFDIAKEIPVSTRRLDDIAECAGADYLKIDVQGAELDALRGAPRTLENTLVVEAEIEFIPLYQNQPLLGDVHVYMAARGFVLHKLIDIQGRPLGPIIFGDCTLKAFGQALWADAIFVKQSLLLTPEIHSPDQLLKAAILFNDVYHSYDLTVHMLRKFDALTGSKTAPAILQFFRLQSPLKRSYMNLIDTLDDLPPEAQRLAKMRAAAIAAAQKRPRA